MKFKKQKLLLGLLLISFMVVSFVSCDDNDDITMPPKNEQTAKLDVKSQALSKNSVIINRVDVPEDGWIVIHADAGDGPQLPDIISVPVHIDKGVSTDIKVSFKSTATINDGDQVWVMLHKDTGVTGTYEFDGSGNGLDLPYLKNKKPVMKEITINKSTATLEVESQVLSQNMALIKKVNVPMDGWIVIHADAGDGPQLPDIISQPVHVEAGESTDIMVPFKSSATINDGDQVWVMLHKDTGETGTYEFDGSGNGLDLPYLMDGAPVMKEIKIKSPEIVAENATYDPATNTVTIPSITTAAEDNWIVIHDQNADGGIVLTDIIGLKALSKGTFTDVKIQLESGVNIQSGQLLFPMLHLDTGVDGDYEFDITTYPDSEDLPVIFGNEDFPANVIFTSFTVQ